VKRIADFIISSLLNWWVIWALLVTVSCFLFMLFYSIKYPKMYDNRSYRAKVNPEFKEAHDRMQENFWKFEKVIRIISFVIALAASYFNNKKSP